MKLQSDPAALDTVPVVTFHRCEKRILNFRWWTDIPSTDPYTYHHNSAKDLQSHHILHFADITLHSRQFINSLYIVEAMLSTVARGYRGRAVVSLSARVPVFADATKRTMADVEVEHARAQWKTYGNLDSYVPGKHHVLTFNKISPIGLKQFPSSSYEIFASGGDASASTKHNAHAILLRSHKLQESEVAHTVRAIARYV